MKEPAEPILPAPPELPEAEEPGILERLASLTGLSFLYKIGAEPGPARATSGQEAEPDLSHARVVPGKESPVEGKHRIKK